MANEPSWDDIFRPVDTVAPTRATVPPMANGQAPMTRRELREAEGYTRADQGGGNGRTATYPGATPPRKKKRRLGWLWALLVLIGLGAGAAWYVWTNYEDKVREVLGWELPNDYSGSGNGEEVTVVIQSGDIGEDVARTLEQSGVTMTFDAFYDLLLARPDVSFEPGNYLLQKEMSAESALAALQNPDNKVVNKVTIPEGTRVDDAYVLLAAATGLTVEDFEAAAADPQAYGLPEKAKTMEGFLFPATYTFDPGVTADQVIQQLVDTMMGKLDEAGVAPEDRWKVITLASVIQRESGPKVEDMAKISRVFLNRIDRGMRLQSDATVHYGLGDTSSVWTTEAQRADASNKYNTYANDGLPIGPIGLPGVTAIDAAVHPADGPWLYFVTVNLKSGKTAFSESLAQHNQAVAQLQEWCRASDENAAYCA